MDYYQFLFESIPQSTKDILVAWLSEAGFSGFEEDENILIAFIPVIKFDKHSFDIIIKSTGEKYSKKIINEINWNAKWEAEFKPAVILYPKTGETFARIRASFHSPSGNGIKDIIITPKMSFGTGHHATTYLMIQQMSLVSFKNKTVIDFGCGTGILSVLSEKMGAESVLAIDIDDWSITNTKENIQVNVCKNIEVIKSDSIPPGEKAQIILANINLNIIMANLNSLIDSCLDDTTVIFSGILASDKQKILHELSEKNIVTVGIKEKNNWIVLKTKYKKE
ncbi:MAG: 50S ribosomal protein L11 methyltransferase [Ferruginibacter sp.]